MTYYKLFPSKEAGFLAAFEMCAEAIFARVEGAIRTAEGMRAQIEAGLSALVELGAERPQMLRVAFVEARAAAVASREAQLSWLSALVTLFTGGEEANWVGQMTLQSMMAIVALEVAAGRTEKLPAMLPELSYVVLAPRLGAEVAAGITGVVASGS